MEARLRRFLGTRLGALAGMVAVLAPGFVILALLPESVGGPVVMVLTLVLIGALVTLKGTGPSEIGLGRPPSWPRTLALAALYTLVAFVLFRLTLEGLLERLSGGERDMSRFAFLEGNLGELLKLVPVLWLTAGFFEEVLFRGFLVTQTAALFGGGRRGVAVGVVVSSLFFGLAHGYQSLSGMILTGTAGAFLALVFVGHGRNLWIPILAHALHDTQGAVLVYLGIYERVTRFLF